MHTAALVVRSGSLSLPPFEAVSRPDDYFPMLEAVAPNEHDHAPGHSHDHDHDHDHDHGIAPRDSGQPSHDLGARVDEVLAMVRASGGRATTARRAILRSLLDEHAEHPTAEQITASVQADHPDVAESTVYRFLDELERLGVVDHVHLGHGPAVYHLVEDTHHHLVCNTCDSVTEVPSGTFDALRAALLRDFGFEIEARHFAIAGRCRECVAAGRQGSRQHH
jgi:Fur family ferric uptake transcriptional regulator